MHTNQDIMIYQAPNGAIELKWDPSTETVWANLDQIASVFGRDKSVISRHIKNIFQEEELDQESTVAFFATVQQEGKRSVTRNIEYYNLDMIISIGYRVNSKVATNFRKWATKTLKNHITEGYTINPHRIQQNYDGFMQAMDEVKRLLEASPEIQPQDTVELVKIFAGTWFSLDAYDKWILEIEHQTEQTISIEADELYRDIVTLKAELITKWEATTLFAEEKHLGNLSGIFGNIFQTAFGEDVYPSIESKAVHLLYFIIKNHPFNDGNKRTGAFAFVWFLQRTGYDFRAKITPEALTSIALFVAMSDPKDKQKVVDLIILLLSGTNTERSLSSKTK